MKPFFAHLLDKMRSNESGNVAVLFAIACVPLISFMGIAIDYTNAMATKVKLQNALDQATMGSIVQSSRAFSKAGAMSADGDIPGGESDAISQFHASVSERSGFNLTTISAKVARRQGVLTSSMTFAADVPTSFTSLLGFDKFTVTGQATANSNMPRSIDFYLLLDNSPSMGVAATPADVAMMVRSTRDKCAFACHDTRDRNNYYNLAKSLGVETRIDVVRKATQQLMDTARKIQAYPGQYRMALYDFGASDVDNNLRRLFALSSDLVRAKEEANAIDLMAVIINNDKNSPFSTAIPALGLEIGPPGTGAPNAPLKYVFFVSDGVADETNRYGCIKRTWGDRCQSPINPSLCRDLKNRGVNVAVLYTTYLALPNNSWYNTWIAPFNAGPYGPSLNSEIASNMRDCASPGLFFEVSPTEGISEAMKELFTRAVSTTRITR